MKRFRMTWRLVLATAVLDAFLVLPVGSVAPVRASHIPQAGCPDVDQITYTDHTPQVTADGATMAWRARTLFAPAWANGGFAAQVMWVGTDSQNSGDRWVEGGITHGWQGQNLFRFYSAHGNFLVSPPVYDESLFPGAPVTVVGTAYGFKGFSVPSPGTPLYRVSVDVGASTYSVTWANHGPNTVNYSGGFEARVGACNSRVDATYVYRNRLRRKSDGIYIDINNGTYTDASGQGTMSWCAQPVTFRYWMHSQISGDVCP